MKPNTAILTLALIAAFSGSAYGQRVELNFSNYAEQTDGSYGPLGPSYSGNTLHFFDVAKYDGVAVDALVTVKSFGEGIDFHGSFPNYNQTVAGNPEGDLGFLYFANQDGVGGVEYTIAFKESGTKFQKAITLSEVSLTAYDVDGESVQSESVIVSKEDGFVEYRVGDGAASVSPTNLGDGRYQFTGPGRNFAEDDKSGAVMMTFRDTDEITMTFESTTKDTDRTGRNGVFSAIDGDASLGAFGPAVSLPEPSSALTMALLSVTTLFMRRRDARRVADLEA